MSTSLQVDAVVLHKLVSRPSPSDLHAHETQLGLRQPIVFNWFHLVLWKELVESLFGKWLCCMEETKAIFRHC